MFSFLNYFLNVLIHMCVYLHVKLVHEVVMVFLFVHIAQLLFHKGYTGFTHIVSLLPLLSPYV